MVRRPPPPSALTPARALRLAMTRAAEESVGLHVAVLGVSVDEGPLDDLLSRLEDGLMLVALYEGDDPVGLVALDAEARSAVIEVQTLGRVPPVPPEPREVTAADVALARPLLTAFLREVEDATAGTVLAGWVRGPRATARIPGPREAMMILADTAYRVVRLTLDLGAGERQGLILLLIRQEAPKPAAADPRTADPPTVAPQVLGAQATLVAVLHRLQLSLADAEGLQVGQIVPLPGVTVASVRVEGGGIDLGPARLGQVAGMRAIRIEEPLTPCLQDIPVAQEPSVEPPLLGPEEDWNL